MNTRYPAALPALFSLLLCAQASAQFEAVAGPNVPEANLLGEHDTSPSFGPHPFHPDHLHHVSFPAAVDNADLIFDGILVSAEVRQPAGTGILVTDYTFRVREWLAGDSGDGLITLTSTGGHRADGFGMTVCGAVKLQPDHRYIVVSRKDADSMALPIARAIQVHASDQLVIDEAGRVVTSLLPDRLGTRRQADYPGLDYLTQNHDFQPEPAPSLAPDDGQAQKSMPDQQQMTPISPEQMLDWIAARRSFERGAILAIDLPVGSDPEPVVPSGQWCGRINGPHNYYNWVPDDTHWALRGSAAGNWNTLVDDNPGGSSWLIGTFLSGGEPIRDRQPNANNGENNMGVISDLQLQNGGYGNTWAGFGANGINFTWYSGVACTRIVEVDTFVNPAIANDQVQHLKSLTHEFGHALGQSTNGAGGHEDRYFAIMFAGTFRQPPNYNSTWYGRMDDMRGVRSFLTSSNNTYPGEWVLEEWVDMATWSQTHDNWGSPGNLVMTDLDTYSGRRGDPITVRGIQVENRGNLPASNVNLHFYLSSNDIISSADFLAGSAFWSTFSAEGRWSNGTRNIQVPANIPAGNYFIGWQLELDESERSTANNTAIMRRSSTFNFQERQFTVIGQPDLNIPLTSLNAPSVSQGSSVNIHVQIANSGDGGSPSTMVRFYRSTNAIISTFDTEIGLTSITPLVPGQTINRNFSAVMNVAGNFYLGACVEATTYEDNTSNLCSTGQFIEVVAVDEVFADRFEP